MSRLYEGETLEELCLFFPAVPSVLERHGVDLKYCKKQTLGDLCEEMGIDVKSIIFEILKEQDIPKGA